LNNDEVPLSRNDFMAIEITIINSPSNVDVGQSNHTFPDAGGTLGRGNDNFWVLDDPNKYMSSVHAKIVCVAEQYFLTDLSTNGTFVNGAAEPIGNGNQISLNDGDHFTISDYEFIVTIANATSNGDIFQGGNDPFADFSDKTPLPSMQDDFLSQSASENDPFASGISQSSSVNNPMSAFDAEQIDPLELLDNAKSSNDPFAQDLFPQSGLSTGAMSQGDDIPDSFTATTSTSIENNNIANDAINWPTANQEAGLIPDDWDDDDLLGDMSSPTSSIPGASSPFSMPTSTPIPAVVPEIVPVPVTAPQPASIAAMSSAEIPQTQPSFVAIPAEQARQNPPQSTASQSEVLVTNKQSDAAYAALELKNQQLQLEVAQLQQQLLQAQALNSSSSAQSSPANMSAETQTVINAMGLSKWNLDDKKVTEINETVGHLMRETMQGMMRVLKFRKKIKEEFRINVTTIQSVENNPLKFSANIDDAMENMFIKENNAYKSPVDAVKEGFQGIAEHQVAVIAGMQAAFRGMIERFDPNNLESRFEKYKSSSLLSLGQKSKRWNAYKQYHQGLVDNLDDSFQHLFGYDFVQAYEEQMQRLISERFAPNGKDKDEPTH
jgi:predicted component of type VI protein secretion system